MTFKLVFCTGVGAGTVCGNNAEFLWVGDRTRNLPVGRTGRGTCLQDSAFTE